MMNENEMARVVRRAIEGYFKDLDGERARGVVYVGTVGGDQHVKLIGDELPGELEPDTARAAGDNGKSPGIQRSHDGMLLTEWLCGLGARAVPRCERERLTEIFAAARGFNGAGRAVPPSPTPASEEPVSPVPEVPLLVPLAPLVAAPPVPVVPAPVVPLVPVETCVGSVVPAPVVPVCVPLGFAVAPVPEGPVPLEPPAVPVDSVGSALGCA